MRKWRRAISVFVMGTMLTVALTACGKKSSSTDTAKSDVEITLLNSKGEIQEGLEAIAEEYEAKTGVSIEVIPCGSGESPFQKISSMYNAGNPPTLAILDTTDVVSIGSEKALDLSNEKWIKEVEGLTTSVDGKVYSFPFCIEGRGIIYNKTAIEKTLGRDFDPASINSFDSLKAIFEELRSKGMENPIVISKEDWSLGAHQLQYIYETYDGTTAGSADIISKIKSGEVSLLDYNRFNDFIQTFDLLKEYNYNKADPLAAIYEQDPIYLADGDAAFWFNGVWAWPNIVEAEGQDNEYGFLPYVLGNDTSDFANNQIQASPSKQLMIDGEKATADQQQAAKDFINYLVYDEAGQKSLVEKCSIIPAAANNAFAPSDPLGQDIKNHTSNGKIFTASAIVPGDHWSVLGAQMQKYLAGECTKEELAGAIESYWTSQK
ncbi:MAG TPA: ABC transporter substrate-binding protein [Lachnospiraceae bacterium]|nr:ABC transporter substrate-binding protein [Lachnospiraceae bacterium]